MTWDTAGFIDGAEVTAEMLRRALWVSTNGSGGIVRPGDLRVTPAPTPAAGVFIQAGGALAVSTYAGSGGAQSYSIYNRSAEWVPIPANTTGSDVYWRVIARVADPQYPGEVAPADPLAASYLVAEAVSTLPTKKPYVWLATVVMPAGASTVTAAQIIDRREMCNPRSKPWLGTVQVDSPKADQLSTVGAFEWWPDQATWTIEVPDWATQVRVQALWSQVLYNGNQFTGNVRVQLGVNTGHDLLTHVAGVDTPASGGNQRATISCADTLAVPAALRGQTITAVLTGQRTSSQANGCPVFDWGSMGSLDLLWIESPVNEDV